MTFNMLAIKDGQKKMAYWRGKRPFKLSYSAFKKIQQCPAQYAMSSLLYWEPKTVDVRNFCLGSVGHACMERWIKEGGMKPGFMQSIAKEEFDKYLRENTVVPLNNKDIGNMREKSVKNAAALEATFVDYDLISKPLVSEGYWSIPMPGHPRVMLTGILDIRVAQESGIIYDLKMTTNAKFMDEDQLCIYCLMGTLSGHRTKKAGFIVPLRKDRIVELEFGPADFQAMYSRLHDELVLIERNLQTGMWEHHYDKSSCYRCGVNQFCSEYKKETALVDRPVSDDGSGLRISL